VVIPAGSAVPTVQHAGSLFEQSLLILGDAIACQVQQQLGIDEGLMNERHANLQ
jgi:6-phospho-3-hexuloisomerase